MVKPLKVNKHKYPAKFWFKKNANIRKCNVQIEYDEHQIEEIIKCRDSYEYFINNYVHIINLDKGLMKFSQYPFQKKMVKLIHKNRFTIFKIPRQSGKTTTVCAYLTWYAIFHPYKTVGIVANKGATAKKILKQIRITYMNLPFWLQQGVAYLSKSRIELENGSLIICQATSEDALSGESINILYWDEVAKVPKGKADDFLNSVYPTISSSETTKIIMTSTPVGYNQFAKFWFDAVNGLNDFKHFEIHYSQVPNRGKKWKEGWIKKLGQSGFDQEFLCEFLGSTNTLISGDKLKTLFHVNPIKTFYDNSLKIYEIPDRNKHYVMTVDVCEGKQKDFHTFSLIDVSAYPFKQIATYRNNIISYLVLPTVIDSFLKIYNIIPLMIIENNNVGHSVLNQLHYDLETDAELFNVSDTELGLRTTKKTKNIGNSTLKSLIEDDKLIIQDYETIDELFNFVQKGVTYKADEGHTDDLVMGLNFFSYLTTTPEFSDFAFKDGTLSENIYKDKMKEVENEIMPAGFNDDGVNIFDLDNTQDDWLTR